MRIGAWQAVERFFGWRADPARARDAGAESALDMPARRLARGTTGQLRGELSSLGSDADEDIVQRVAQLVFVLREGAEGASEQARRGRRKLCHCDDERFLTEEDRHVCFRIGGANLRPKHRCDDDGRHRVENEVGLQDYDVGRRSCRPCGRVRANVELPQLPSPQVVAEGAVGLDESFVRLDGFGVLFRPGALGELQLALRQLRRTR